MVAGLDVAVVGVTTLVVEGRIVVSAGVVVVVSPMDVVAFPSLSLEGLLFPHAAGRNTPIRTMSVTAVRWAERGQLPKSLQADRTTPARPTFSPTSLLDPQQFCPASTAGTCPKSMIQG